jgi:hypothetical protein
MKKRVNSTPSVTANDPKNSFVFTIAREDNERALRNRGQAISMKSLLFRSK